MDKDKRVNATGPICHEGELSLFALRVRRPVPAANRRWARRQRRPLVKLGRDAPRPGAEAGESSIGATEPATARGSGFRLFRLGRWCR